MTDITIDHINKMLRWPSGVREEAISAFIPRTIVLLNPAVTTNPIPLGPVWADMTVYEIQTFVQGLSPSITFKIYHGLDIDGTGEELVEAGSTVNTSTVDSITTFDNPEIDAGEIMWAHITAKTGTVYSFCAFVHVRLRIV